MYGVVFGRSHRLQVFGVVALNPAHEGHAQLGRQEGILAVGFLAAAPAGITEDVDVGRPQGEAEINGVVAFPLRLVVVGARFRRDHFGLAAHQGNVPGGRHADSLREDGGIAGARDAMQRLAPPVVRRHTQPGDRRSGVLHLEDLLLQRQARNQVVHPLFDGKRGVAKRGRRGWILGVEQW